MASMPHRLPLDRAERVEQKLRARAAQLKPLGQLKARTMPLGICCRCAKVVFTGESLAMAGIYLLHADCCADAADGVEAP